MDSKKEVWIALMINFFAPGGGHWYAGESKGIPLLIVTMVAIVLMPFLYFPGVIVFALWVYTMATSKNVVDSYNAILVEKEIEDEKTKSKLITPEDLAAEVNKANKLLASEIINKTEFEALKQEILNNLQFKILKGSTSDFLLALAPLKKNGLLTDDEIVEFKKILSTKDEN